MKLSIQKALLPDAMPIARLLDEVTVQLHQKGILQWEHPWDPDKIGQDILLERVWACRDGKELVGTFSLRPLQTALWLDRRAKPDGQWYLYRIALRPSCQGSGLGTELIRFACCLADHAQKDLYLDCWAGNHALRRFYSSANFDTVGIFPEENYQICVFSRYFRKEG